MMSQSLKRQQRGAAAHILLSLHEADQLGSSELWTWDVLDALPVWCLKDESARVALQLLCGAFVLAPELRFWIDRKFILIAHELIGKEHFNHIVLKADQAPIEFNATVSDRFKSGIDESVLQDSIRTIFMQAGASVLKATLTNELLNEMFSKVLGETAGAVTSKVANNILIQAQGMLEEIKPTTNPASANTNDTASIEQVQA